MMPFLNSLIPPFSRRKMSLECVKWDISAAIPQDKASPKKIVPQLI